jgi:cell wall-associated NlpC family hydrolase
MARLALGGGISFEDFFAAIAQQESGGDYGAVNPRTGASGKYQILPGNIGPWSEQYLGRRISVSAFRRSPKLQEQLARAVLRSYFDRYGARGAAAAWYSGSPKNAGNYHRSRPNEPSPGEYVDQVMHRAGNVAPGSQASTPPPGPSSPGTLEIAPLATPTSAIDAPGEQSLAAAENDLLAAPTFDTFGSTLGQSQAAGALGSSQSSLGMSFTPGYGRGSDPQRDKIISRAMQYIGTPYVWGGASPKGFDCSGLIQYVYGQEGYYLPRISADQARSGRRVSLDQLRPGDLVATDNSPRNAGADHIAIWLGNGQILEAPKPGKSVRVRNIGKNEGFYGVALDI